MKFVQSGLRGVWWIDLEPASDERGFFARSFDVESFAAHGLVTHFPQASISYTARRGTLRGLHFQEAPHGEAKLISCVAGAGFDVVVDLRPRSPTRLRHVITEFRASTHRQLYVPEGFAHGFLALEDGTTLSYHLSAPYRPEAAKGLRWDDPRLGIHWPEQPQLLSTRDREWPLMID